MTYVPKIDFEISDVKISIPAKVIQNEIEAWLKNSDEVRDVIVDVIQKELGVALETMEFDENLIQAFCKVMKKFEEKTS